MDIEEFWETIEEANRRSPPESNRPIKSHLVDVLSEHNRNELAEWEKLFCRYMDHAYFPLLWDAVVLAYEGFHNCGDDSFRDFRETLIASGRENYFSITSNPDELCDHTDLLEAPMEFFISSAADAWRLQDSAFPECSDLNAEQIVWEEMIIPATTFKEVKRLLPRITKKLQESEPEYWECLHLSTPGPPATLHTFCENMILRILLRYLLKCVATEYTDPTRSTTQVSTAERLSNRPIAGSCQSTYSQKRGKKEYVCAQNAVSRWRT